jgi:RHS repeat-associated protein
VRQLADSRGFVVQRYAYGPFGEPLSAEGSRTSALRYTGEHWDGDAGLLYLRARWYDPATSRFLSKDPFPGLAAFPQTQHAYVYCANNPVNLTDPSGKLIGLIIGGALVGAGIGAIIGGVTSGVFYALAHPGQDVWHSPGFWDAVSRGAASGAVAGAITGAVAPLLAPLAGTLPGAIGVGGLLGGLGGGVGQIVNNYTIE